MKISRKHAEELKALGGEFICTGPNGPAGQPLTFDQAKIEPAKRLVDGSLFQIWDNPYVWWEAVELC